MHDVTVNQSINIYFTFFRSLENNDIDHLPARIFQNLPVLYYMYVHNFNQNYNKNKQSPLAKILNNPLKSFRTFVIVIRISNFWKSLLSERGSLQTFGTIIRQFGSLNCQHNVSINEACFRWTDSQSRKSSNTVVALCSRVEADMNSRPDNARLTINNSTLLFELELEILLFVERGKPDNPFEKPPLIARRQPTTNSTHIMWPGPHQSWATSLTELICHPVLFFLKWPVPQQAAVNTR